MVLVAQTATRCISVRGRRGAGVLTQNGRCALERPRGHRAEVGGMRPRAQRRWGPRELGEAGGTLPGASGGAPCHTVVSVSLF